MAEKQSIRIRRFSVLALILGFVAPALSPVWSADREEKLWEEVDVSPILTALRQRGVETTERDCEELVRSNLKHIYFNTLQTEQFLGMPKPDRVADQVSRVFSLSHGLRSLLDEAHALSAEKASAHTLRKTAREIGQRAGALHRRFCEYFREDDRAECALKVAPSESSGVGFERYLARCEAIWTALDSELDRYFLSPSPGTIELSAYRTCSISQLSLSLRKLSDEFDKSLSAK
jgi:hypothetical protein